MLISDNTTVYVDFCIDGDEFDPIYITNLMNIEPTCAYKKGDEGKYVKNNRWPYGMWSLRTEERETMEISDEVDELLKIFNGKEAILQKIKNLYPKCKYMFSVVIYTKNMMMPAIHFNRRQLEFINLIDAEIDFDIYT